VIQEALEDAGLFKRIRIIFQIPRIYSKFKAGGKVDNLATMYQNIFAPMLDAIHHPNLHPEIFGLLK
jgi:hypothetical protein